MPALLAILTLLGCHAEPDHALYLQALHADAADGWDTCLRIVDVPLRSECQATRAARDLQFDRCGEIATPVWKDECWFEAAEAEARAGDKEEALSACRRGGFAQECQDHVLGMLAMTWLADPVPVVADRYEALRPGLVDPSLDLLFWRHYYRNRLAQGMAMTRVGCPGRECRAAAETEVEAALSRELGPERRVCFTPHTFPWAQDEDGHALLARALTRVCEAHPTGRWHPPTGGPP